MKLPLLFLIFLTSYSFTYSQQSFKEDSSRVDELNKLAYEIRWTDPEETITSGTRALHLAEKLNYKSGMAEAFRVIGIGNFYMNHTDTAISKYLTSLSIFTEIHNEFGQAKVLNNIGNLYREVDFARAISYFDRAHQLARKHKILDLEAGALLNKGIVYFRGKNYLKALRAIQESGRLFKKINNSIGITQALQNEGVIYFKMGQLDKAKALLLEAINKAKLSDLNDLTASIDLTLTSIFIAEKKYEKAREYLNEGLTFARIVKDKKLEVDFIFTSSQLEEELGNYKTALKHLREVFRRDSMVYETLESRKITLLQEQHKFFEREKENQLLLEREKRNKVILIAGLIVLALSLLVIFLLIVNNKKKAKTNKQLQVLNEEISLQKENLDKINQNLEALVDERTQDLQIKNQKLSEYSSHLSHVIRSPVATLKGLILLNNEKLIDSEEFATEVTNCANDMDDKILNINQMLHNPTYKGSNYVPSRGDEEQ